MHRRSLHESYVVVVYVCFEGKTLAIILWLFNEHADGPGSGWLSL